MHSYQIGGLTFSISSEIPWSFLHEGLFSSFVTNQDPDLLIQNTALRQLTLPAGSPLFDSGQTWRLFQENGKWVIWIRSRERNPFLAGYFDQDFKKGEIYSSLSTEDPGKYIFPLGYPLGGILMTSLLGTGYGIMLHSSGVVDRSQGYVFAGISTAGKTTTSRLWQNTKDALVLNDDHNIIRKINSEFSVFGTPWHGQGGIAVSANAPLKKIFILKHAPENKAVRLPPAKAAAALLVRAFAPLWSAEAMAFTLQFLEELCETIPCYEYGFVPDQSAVEYIRCLKSE